LALCRPSRDGGQLLKIESLAALLALRGLLAAGRRLILRSLLILLGLIVVCLCHKYPSCFWCGSPYPVVAPRIFPRGVSAERSLLGRQAVSPPFGYEKTASISTRLNQRIWFLV
jgi:hypothetical protein